MNRAQLCKSSIFLRTARPSRRRTSHESWIRRGWFRRAFKEGLRQGPTRVDDHRPCTEEDILSRHDFRDLYCATEPIPLEVRLDHAAPLRPSCSNAVTPSSRPICSAILPFEIRSTVVPENRIFWADAAGRQPTRKSQ